MTPNDHYSGRTAPLSSKCCILYIYSTNTGTEYFKHGIYSPFFPLQNAVCFINPTYLVPVLFTFYIQGVLKLKKNSGAKRLKESTVMLLYIKDKSKSVPLQAWIVPESSRKLRFPDLMKKAQEVGKVVILTHRPPLPPGNTPGTHFC